MSRDIFGLLTRGASGRLIGRAGDRVSVLMASTLTKIVSVLDPRTGDTVTQVPITEPADCDEAVGRAAAAADAWARTTPAERAAAIPAAAADVSAELRRHGAAFR